jgi:tRNA 2-thiouridine synthesizing protein A
MKGARSVGIGPGTGHVRQTASEIQRSCRASVCDLPCAPDDLSLCRHNLSNFVPVVLRGGVRSLPHPYVTTLARFPPDPHNMRMSETLLDVKGMNCPLPVLRANRSLRSMAPGERLRVLATDRAAIADFKAFCQETGHALIAMSEEAGVLSFVIRRRPDPDPGSPNSGQRDTNPTGHK